MLAAMIRRLACAAALSLLLSPAVASDDRHAVLRTALLGALADWPAVTVGAPEAETLRRRIAEDEETLRRLEQRRRTLDRRLDHLEGRIELLQDRVVEDPGAMRTPRDQVTLVALQDQRETTRRVRDTLTRSIAALRRERARDEVRLLAAEGGRAALEERLDQLTP